MITLDGKVLGAEELRQGIQEGSLDALRVMIELKKLDNQIDFVREVASKAAADEAAKFGQKSFDYHGAKIELSELGTKYNYSNCNYPPYQQASKQAKEASELVRQSEQWLKSIKGKTEFIDPETGELCDVFPPMKTSTTGIKITLAK